MLAWIVFGWLAVNYALAAQLFYQAARRDCASHSAALAFAAAWPLASLRARPLRN